MKLDELFVGWDYDAACDKLTGILGHNRNLIFIGGSVSPEEILEERESRKKFKNVLKNYYDTIIKTEYGVEKFYRSIDVVKKRREMSLKIFDGINNDDLLAKVTVRAMILTDGIKIRSMGQALIKHNLGSYKWN
ncbi:hypothetical protein COU61_03810 [Candidatus Pacearchaeota archaeon CG10_big_fil_rev_8_21_14_0_10_35_13]|nr:MAG: hypothetical protein COU61_03810 [Candidatus Pacearchaeota archaeon CG10_big_fil_rev_8_21_14_0_10_35_13]